jgi:hypothetical protein
MATTDLSNQIEALHDDALVKWRTLKPLLLALARRGPLPGHNVRTREMPDGILVDAIAGDRSVLFPFRVTIEDGLVIVQPGYWLFEGQDTFPGFDGDIFGGEGPPPMITVEDDEIWRVWLWAEHNTEGVLSGPPYCTQSVEAIPAHDPKVKTRVLLARASGPGQSFEFVQNFAGGSLITRRGLIYNTSGTLVTAAATHASY